MYDLEDDGLPLGLTMQLAQDEDAMRYFATLPKSEQEHLIEYIKSSKTGDEAKRRIDEVIELCQRGEKFY
ncbi:YdeI/OmpD-associated family protein [Niameybacter massiliensis]|uniref:YdeI/OmpD-associated family protein n=1 Tax=Holtiella tumoricola TaxID=3018743 RepID=A0AA42IZR5_9FIRM|nr:YdeI/OmpD-associated family protein [Holtiella tumoricola]MDA3730308.1 YdeI/OmpD-associated family protein [Holtiella tumoricola]